MYSTNRIQNSVDSSGSSEFGDCRFGGEGRLRGIWGVTHLGLDSARARMMWCRACGICALYADCSMFRITSDANLAFAHAGPWAVENDSRSSFSDVQSVQLYRVEVLCISLVLFLCMRIWDSFPN